MWANVIDMQEWLARKSQARRAVASEKANKELEMLRYEMEEHKREVLARLDNEEGQKVESGTRWYTTQNVVDLAERRGKSELVDGE